MGQSIIESLKNETNKHMGLPQNVAAQCGSFKRRQSPRHRARRHQEAACHVPIFGQFP
jgi:hypothetical protein